MPYMHHDEKGNNAGKTMAEKLYRLAYNARTVLCTIPKGSNSVLWTTFWSTTPDGVPCCKTVYLGSMHSAVFLRAQRGAKLLPAALDIATLPKKDYTNSFFMPLVSKHVVAPVSWKRGASVKGCNWCFLSTLFFKSAPLGSHLAM